METLSNEDKAKLVGDNPKQLEHELRDHVSVLNGKEERKQSNWKLDLFHKRLVYKDGVHSIQWKVRMHPELPESYNNQQTSVGSTVMLNI
jgi:hypothetical protein